MPDSIHCSIFCPKNHIFIDIGKRSLGMYLATSSKHPQRNSINFTNGMNSAVIAAKVYSASGHQASSLNCCRAVVFPNPGPVLRPQGVEHAVVGAEVHLRSVHRRRGSARMAAPASKSQVLEPPSSLTAYSFPSSDPKKTLPLLMAGDDLTGAPVWNCQTFDPSASLKANMLPSSAPTYMRMLFTAGEEATALPTS
eukprot:CAMPEP_0181538032 /NCGR_PEP_ID=MMETSP1110-20121109/75655_1 /TAXON_ID=174948 /ORGANISM="Symbiodinium sp., Strain CCMP421" /LENGTH=195 /DNA_ID=CAMNT_0023669617 /DNA_START=77 /DNA_END=664 /DNA_ORIENTATION=+